MTRRGQREAQTTWSVCDALPCTGLASSSSAKEEMRLTRRRPLLLHPARKTSTIGNSCRVIKERTGKVVRENATDPRLSSQVGGPARFERGDCLPRAGFAFHGQSGLLGDA